MHLSWGPRSAFLLYKAERELVVIILSIIMCASDCATQRKSSIKTTKSGWPNKDPWGTTQVPGDQRELLFTATCHFQERVFHPVCYSSMQNDLRTSLEDFWISIYRYTQSTNCLLSTFLVSACTAALIFAFLTNDALRLYVMFLMSIHVIL